MTRTIELAGNLNPVKTPLEGEEIEKSFLALVGEAVKHYEENRVEDEERKHVGTKEAVVGTTESGVMSSGDYGLFSTILHCYNNHYTLRTTPEDWWYTVLRTVAYAVDEASEEEEVREFFVGRDGRKDLTVHVGDPGCIPHGVEYEKFFSDMSDLIRDNIKVPGYVDAFRSDFSTSTSTHVIESEITLMSSVQSYFEYRMNCRCGIPQIEMLGTEADWRRLKEKLKQLQNILNPIEGALYSITGWWGKVEIICDKLVDTYTGQPDVAWWSHIFNTTKVEGWGSGMRMIWDDPSLGQCSNHWEELHYDGWFITDLLNICNSVLSFEDLPSGLTSVPVTLENGDGSEEKGAFVSGILGMRVDRAPNVTSSVQALHGWALFMEPKDAGPNIINDKTSGAKKTE